MHQQPCHWPLKVGSFRRPFVYKEIIILFSAAHGPRCQLTHRVSQCWGDSIVIKAVTPLFKTSFAICNMLRTVIYLIKIRIFSDGFFIKGVQQLEPINMSRRRRQVNNDEDVFWIENILMKTIPETSMTVLEVCTLQWPQPLHIGW